MAAYQANRDLVERERAPKSFVIRAGRIGKSAGALVRDVRQVMEPNTASRLREREKNRLRDFLSMAGPLGVSHMLIFHQTATGINMRILRAPRGPTVTFRVNKFALTGDIIRSSRRPAAIGNEYTTPPMLVLNNFGSEERHVRLLVTVFQNLFPPLHVHSMRLSQARRIVLLSYNAETRTIDWRHYLISVRPVGVSRSVRRIIEGTTRPSSASSGSVTGKGADGNRKGRSLVNLANANDIAEYVVRGSAAAAGEDTDNSEAESEAEDMADPANAVELAQDYLGRGNAANTQRAVRLREVGPRMELRLVKVEEGLNGSEVLYHDYGAFLANQSTALRRRVRRKRATSSSAASLPQHGAPSRSATCLAKRTPCRLPMRQRQTAPRMRTAPGKTMQMRMNLRTRTAQERTVQRRMSLRMKMVHSAMVMILAAMRSSLTSTTTRAKTMRIATLTGLHLCGGQRSDSHVASAVN